VLFFAASVFPPAGYKEEVYLLFCMVVQLGYQRKGTQFAVDKYL
jgi:hypothetical protein